MSERKPPAFAKDSWAWAKTLARITEQSGRSYDEWTPPQFKAANKLYHNIVAKAERQGHTADGEPTPPLEPHPTVKPPPDFLTLKNWNVARNLLWASNDNGTYTLKCPAGEPFIPTPTARLTAYLDRGTLTYELKLTDVAGLRGDPTAKSWLESRFKKVIEQLETDRNERIERVLVENIGPDKLVSQLAERIAEYEAALREL